MDCKDGFEGKGGFSYYFSFYKEILLLRKDAFLSNELYQSTVVRVLQRKEQ